MQERAVVVERKGSGEWVGVGVDETLARVLGAVGVLVLLWSTLLRDGREIGCVAG